MLTGDGGLINRAIIARDTTNESADLEYVQTEAYALLGEYYDSGKTGEMSVTDYVLENLPKDSNGITTNKEKQQVKYKGKIYDISQIIGRTNEQQKLAKEDLKQVEDSELLKEESVKMVVQEKDNPENQAIIPVGFYYVAGTPSDGMIISDKYGDDENNGAGGNQFVWVPCGENGEKYEKKNGLATTWKSKYSGKQWYYNTIPTGETYGANQGKTITDWRDNGGDEESVTKYGGFYVARFEAGVPNDAGFYANKEGDVYTSAKNNTTYAPVSKKNNQSWNYISQKNAIEVSKKMYDENSSAVKSRLIDSYAWDTIVEWMSEEIPNIGNDSTSKGNYANNSSLVVNGLYALHKYNTTRDSEQWSSSWNVATKYKKSNGEIKTGSKSISQADRNNYEWADSTYDDTKYSGYTVYKEIATGSADTKIKNIYDMAGNMYEWTTETGSHVVTENPDITGEGSCAVLRGGYFGHNGSSAPVSYRNGNYGPAGTSIIIGFRVVLYIK